MSNTEIERVEPGEEVLGDQAPVLKPAQLAQISDKYVPTDPFGGSTVLTTKSALSLGQLRQEISNATGISESDIQVAYSCPNADAPVSGNNPASVFVHFKGGHSATQKALAKVLAEHVPADAPVDPAAPDAPPLIPVQPLDPEAAALAERAKAGDTLSTKEISSLLGALLG